MVKPSLYAEYIKERTTDGIVETEKGFATYRFLSNNRQIYIIDIFVLPEFRRTDTCKEMVDTIISIGKDNGCTELLGTIVPSMKGSKISMKVLTAYGLEIDSAGPDLIIMKKDI